MTRNILLFNALFALAMNSACVVSHTQSAISPSTIVRMQPAHYADVRSISGYLRFDSHSRQLWDSEAALRENDAPKCVTLVNTLPFEDNLRSADSSFVEIEGFPVEDVLDENVVDVGACNSVGFYVRRVRALGGRN